MLRGRPLWLLAGGLAIVVACGGSTSTGLDGNGSSGSSGDGGASGQPYTLDDVCARTGPLVCDLRKPCCQSGVGYDETGCLANAKKDCDADVAAARAGQETFHPERIDDCLTKLKDILAASCALTFEQIRKKYAPTITACATFEGQVPLGGACERSSQCKPGTDATQFVSCDEDTKTCKMATFLSEGKPCALGDGAADFCAEGLYCDVLDFSKKPLAGVCKKSTSVGVACDKTKKPLDLECGLGNYCDVEKGLCSVGKPAGASCTNALECLAVECEKGADGGAATGTCARLKPIVDSAQCKGS